MPAPYRLAGRYSEPLLDPFGNGLPGASVAVYAVGTTTPVTLYRDATKATTAANPVTSAGVGSTIDALGNLTVFADPGPYDTVTTVGTRVGPTVRIVVPLDPAEAAQVGSDGKLLPAQSGTTEQPWLFTIPPVSPVAHVNFNNLVLDVSQYLGFQLQSAGSVDNEWSTDVVLAAGTWSVELVHVTGTERGDYAVQLDNGAGVFTTVGTISGYSASLTKNVISTLTGVVVASPIKRRLKLKMATKNAASTGFFGSFSQLQLRRTA